MKETEPKEARCISEVLKAFEHTLKQWEMAKPWFRGQARTAEDGQFPLLPAVFRLHSRLNTQRSGKEERAIAKVFQFEAPARYASCPGMQEYGQWLALMQHYRLATRLLDWTRSLLTAVHFAVREDDYLEEPGAVFFLEIGLLNHETVGRRGVNMLVNDPDKIVQALVSEAFGPPPTDATKELIVAVVAPVLDMRMLAQQTCFTIHDSRAKPLNKHPKADEFLRMLIIPDKDAKLYIRHELENIGVDDATVFPDLEHLAYVANRMKWVP